MDTRVSHYPAPDTKVRVIKMYPGSEQGGKPGDILYTTSWSGNPPLDAPNTIPVHRTTGHRAGLWCAEWELVEPGVIGELDDATKQALTDKAHEAATELGYCSETKRVLKAMGLPTEPTANTKKVTVEIEYTVKDGYYFLARNLLYNDNHTKNGNPVIRISNVRQVN